MSHRTVGVVGAGVMGAGVAHDLARTGHDVVLVDISRAALERAEQEIRQLTRLQVLMRAGHLSSPDAVLARVLATVDHGRLADADFVVENVTERWSVKAEVYERLDAICAARTVIAANTSAISITRLASVTGRADRIVGIHFMNPVFLKPLVEVIRGTHTSDETLAATAALLRGMGKDWVVVDDAPGFVTSRVLMLTLNEAIWLLQDRVATATDVDRLFKGCFGHRMGPLETADLIGLDTVLLSLEALQESYGDPKFRPCPLLRRMVAAGTLGRKSGSGFFDYAAVAADVSAVEAGS